MTVNEATNLMKSLNGSNLKTIEHSALSYAIGRTFKRLETLLRPYHKKMRLPAEDEKEQARLHNEMIKRYRVLMTEKAIVDDKGVVIRDERGEPKLPPNALIEIDEQLREEFPKLEEYNNKLNEIKERILEEEIDDERIESCYFKISARGLPKNLTLNKLEPIMDLIDGHIVIEEHDIPDKEGLKKA